MLRPFILKVKMYLKQRFPIIPLLVYAAATQLGIAAVHGVFSIQKTIILALLYVLFLFHLRVLDEFKDHTYDSTHFPDRPVQRGIISLGELKVLGVLTIICIVIAGLFVGSLQINMLLYVALVYTFLMYKEFFMRNFIKERFTLYLMSHEIVFIPLFLFFFSSYARNLWVPASFAEVSLLIYSILPIIIIEIGRKIKHRYDPSGKKTDDTYAYRWGQVTTLVVFAGLIVAGGIISWNIDGFNRIVTIGIVGIGLTIMVGSNRYIAFFVRHSMIMTTLCALGLPLLLLL